MSLGEKSRFRVPLTNGPVRSLSWNGNELIDWAGGGRRFSLDGSEIRSHIHWAYRFDRAISSRDGTYQVIYETLGTKGLVLKGNKVVREINRSFYHANVYEFPVAILDLPDGGVGLAHSPDEYNELQIEEIEFGHQLTARDGKSPDFFHSRLQASPDGEYLLSAGWIWHPLDRALLFSVHEALERPEHLDEPLGLELPEEFFEINTAAFQSNNSLLLIGRREEDDESSIPFVCRYNFKDSRIEAKSRLEAVPGTIMPVGADHFVGFHEHPKLFEIASGKIIQSWSELNSGKQISSIIGERDLPPPLALDPENKRFAVASEKEIVVVQLG